MDTEKTYYEILGVGAGSSRGEIVKAFRDVVKEHHPDRFTTPDKKKEAEDYLKTVTEAFNTISKPDLRRKYDESLQKSTSKTKTQSVGEQVERFMRQGRLKLDLEDFQSALALFDHVLRLDPDNAEALFQAGMVRLKNPKWRTQGSGQVESAIERAPFRVSYVIDYARFLLDNGQVMRARRFLEKGAASFPDNKELEELLKETGGDKPSGFSLFGKKR